MPNFPHKKRQHHLYHLHQPFHKKKTLPENPSSAIQTNHPPKSIIARPAPCNNNKKTPGTRPRPSARRIINLTLGPLYQPALCPEYREEGSDRAAAPPGGAGMRQHDVTGRFVDCTPPAADRQHPRPSLGSIQAAGDDLLSPWDTAFSRDTRLFSCIFTPGGVRGFSAGGLARVGKAKGVDGFCVLALWSESNANACVTDDGLELRGLLGITGLLWTLTIVFTSHLHMPLLRSSLFVWKSVRLEFDFLWTDQKRPRDLAMALGKEKRGRRRGVCILTLSVLGVSLGLSLCAYNRKMSINLSRITAVCWSIGSDKQLLLWT